MNQALRFTDEKSDKFWRVETAGNDLVINWGKTGTTGRYEIKEFDSEEVCTQQALKLAGAKQKKGYALMPEFDPIGHFYFDTDEYGLHPLTSHPIFRKHFSNELYYDCGDEEAPFGSDEGNDTLHLLEEALRKRPNMSVTDFPQKLIEKEWDLTYFPPNPAQTDEELRQQTAQQYHSLPGSQMILQTDQVVVATALGQIKITGKLDDTLQKIALHSLNRMEKLYRILWHWNDDKPPYPIAIMKPDLTQFSNRIAGL